MAYTFGIPVRTQSEANLREHWAQRHRRSKMQKKLAHAYTVLAGLPPLRQDLPNIKRIVTLTRIGPRKLDTDNLAGSFKHVQDSIADAMNVDDGDDRIEWKYEQRKGEPKEYMVYVSVEDVLT